MKKSKSGRKKKLTLSELEQSKASVLTGLGSVQSHRSYNRAIEEFIDWYCSEPILTLNRKAPMALRPIGCRHDPIENRQLRVSIHVPKAPDRQEAPDASFVQSALLCIIQFR